MSVAPESRKQAQGLLQGIKLDDDDGGFEGEQGERRAATREVLNVSRSKYDVKQTSRHVDVLKPLPRGSQASVLPTLTAGYRRRILSK